MGNVSSNEIISELFAEKCCNLYNSVSFNDDELEVIRTENTCDVQVRCTDDGVTVISDNYIHTHCYLSSIMLVIFYLIVCTHVL